MTTVHLHLTYQPEDDHHGELHAVAEVAGFRGHGAAWFNRSALETFAKELSQYPLPQGQCVILSGGEGIGADGSPVSIDLGISISPFDSRGSLRVDVELAHHIPVSGSNDLSQTAYLSFLTAYGDLEAFSRGVAAMLRNGGEAVLVGRN